MPASGFCDLGERARANLRAAPEGFRQGLKEFPGTRRTRGGMLLRQVEIQRVIGRRLIQRLVDRELIVPVRVGTGIFFDSHRLHLALGRLARHDNDWRPGTRNVQPVLDEILANLSLDE